MDGDQTQLVATIVWSMTDWYAVRCHTGMMWDLQRWVRGMPDVNASVLGREFLKLKNELASLLKAELVYIHIAWDPDDGFYVEVRFKHRPDDIRLLLWTGGEATTLQAAVTQAIRDIKAKAVKIGEGTRRKVRRRKATK